LYGRLELMYDFFECCTVGLYHFGKVCWGFGFLFLVCLFFSKVNTVVGVGITSIGIIGSITAAFGIGIGDSSSIYSEGVPGAINCCCGSEAVSSSNSSGCSGVVVVVAWINMFKGFQYEVWVMVLEDVVFLQEGPIDGNSSVC